MYKPFCVLLVFIAGCNATHSGEWVTDSELLRSIDFDSLQPEDVPALIALFEEHSFEICELANEALAKIGEPAIAPLVDKLKPGFQPKDFVVRSRVRRALKRIGPSAIPSLIKALNDDSYDHISVVHTLGDIEPTTDEAVLALIAALDEDRTRVASISALGRLGRNDDPVVQAAVPAIVALLAHEDSEVRGEAASVLWSIDVLLFAEVVVRDNGVTAPTLPALRNDSELMRSIDFDDPRPEQVPILIKLFEDHSHEVFRLVSESLIAIGEPSSSALVEALYKEKPVLVRVRAAEVLWRLGPNAIPAVAAAIDDIRNDEARYDVVRLIYVIGRIRPVTADAVALLLDVVDEYDARSIEEWQAISALKEALIALKFLGPRAKNAVPRLLPLLQHRDQFVRSWAARALWNIDRDTAQEAGLKGPRPPLDRP